MTVQQATVTVRRAIVLRGAARPAVEKRHLISILICFLVSLGAIRASRSKEAVRKSNIEFIINFSHRILCDFNSDRKLIFKFIVSFFRTILVYLDCLAKLDGNYFRQ